MDNYGPQLEKVIADGDLFEAWQEELAQRLKLRKTPEDLTRITAEEDIGILWRALAFSGRKKKFWSIMAQNMHLAPVLSWLAADETRLADYLSFLVFYLQSDQLEFNKLRSLINLYSAKFDEHFMAILAVLDTDTCSLLGSHSANPHWRRLIKKRIREQQNTPKPYFYGLDRQISNSKSSAAQEEKINLLIKGIELTRAIASGNITADSQPGMLLEAADVFFKAGMINDSLLLLMGLCQDFPSLLRTDPNLASRQFIKLLRKTVSIYSLINKPEAPNFFAAGIYQKYFPGLLPDNVAQKYLYIYSLAAEASRELDKSGLLKIAYTAEQISAYRPDEDLLLGWSDIENGLNETRTGQLKALAEQKMISMPHEAFIILQLLQLLVNMRMVGSGAANFILTKTLELFQWLPSRLFISNSGFNSLIGLANDENRNAVNRIMEQVKLSVNADPKSQSFRGKDDAILRLVTAGKYLGVL